MRPKKKQQEGPEEEEDAEKRVVHESERVAAEMKEDFDVWLEQELCQNDVTALIFYRGLF